MQLVINTYGAYLHREGKVFVLKVDGKSSTVAARKVQSILMITTGAAFSSDAIQLAVENNIDVVFVDKFGDPYDRVWPSRISTRIRMGDASPMSESIEIETMY